MPVFFNEQTLNNIDYSHYEACVAEYIRIQYENAEKEKNILRSLGKLTARVAIEIDNKAKYYKPSNKSALFWRLLQGKPALTKIPPTSFSYPWYQLYEEDGPFEVSVNWNQTEEHILNLPFLPLKKDKILINHALWHIVSYNEAGSKVLELNGHKTQEEIKEIFNLKPEIIVTFDQEQDFRLFLGRKSIYGRRVTIFSKGISLENGGGNPVILEVIKKDNDEIIGNISKNKLVIPKPIAATQGDNEPIHDLDWLKVEIDAWLLEPIK